jgi:hypothetical protein
MSQRLIGASQRRARVKEKLDRSGPGETKKNERFLTSEKFFFSPPSKNAITDHRGICAQEQPKDWHQKNNLGRQAAWALERGGLRNQDD